MKKSNSVNAKRRGRPVTTGTGTVIGVRMLDDRLTAIDTWIEKHEADIGRPEAIRRLVDLGLKAKVSK
jgi:hypothetical protein